MKIVRQAQNSKSTFLHSQIRCLDGSGDDWVAVHQKEGGLCAKTSGIEWKKKTPSWQTWEPSKLLKGSLGGTAKKALSWYADRCPTSSWLKLAREGAVFQKNWRMGCSTCSQGAQDFPIQRQGRVLVLEQLSKLRRSALPLQSSLFLCLLDILLCWFTNSG